MLEAMMRASGNMRDIWQIANTERLDVMTDAAGCLKRWLKKRWETQHYLLKSNNI